jgi:hypothetical protein
MQLSRRLSTINASHAHGHIAPRVRKLVAGAGSVDNFDSMFTEPGTTLCKALFLLSFA